MLPCVYHSHKFVLSAYLIIQAVLEIEKMGVDSSCVASHTSVISILLPFGQFSLLLLRVWIIAINFILFLLLLLLPPKYKLISIWQKATRLCFFPPLPSKNICPPYFHLFFSPSYHFIPFIRTHVINFLTNCVHLLLKI